MHDIFIAHAKEDAGLAEALYQALMPQADCFLDTRRILPGDDWDRIIVKAQRESSITVVIVTANSDDAYYQREEVAAAIAYSRAAPDSHTLIPLVYTENEVRPPLLYGLHGKYAIEISSERDIPQAAEKVMTTLSEVRERRQLSLAQAMTRTEELDDEDAQRSAQFAFVSAFDVKDFSRFTADEQIAVYSTLQLAISDAMTELRMEISKKLSGTVFWSQGGDGGILSRVGADAISMFRAALLTLSSLQSRIASSYGPRFSIVAALDCGLVHLRLDLNGAPNIWGEPPNRVHRMLSVSEPGELLASADFVDRLRSQTNEFEELVGARRLRATKRERTLSVHTILTGVVQQTPQSGESVDIVDFEAPYREMVSQYRSLARGAADSASGVWSLLLARKQLDLGDIPEREFKRVVSSVAVEGRLARATSPFHQLFSRFTRKSLIHAMQAGTFRQLLPDEELCHHGDEANEMYIVAEGRINVIGDHGIVVSRGPGELIGEMALVEPVTQRMQSTGRLRNASLVAANAATVFAIPYSALLERTDEISDALTGYYRRRRKESILAANETFKLILRLMSRDDFDVLIESARLVGLDNNSESSIGLEGPSLFVPGEGIVRIKSGDGTERLQESNTKPLLLVPGKPDVEIRLTAMKHSEFAYLDHDAWTDWSELAESRGALQPLAANMERWELA